ncbi:sensor histidine kinase [Kribbella jiaozuonensis]|uniref:histidine kinase n=1 Tax=Kribbella jiaozuonensis TaxID=2575441 RepID=A0A4U3LWR1_9ACTN|nr:HAMP domain-containing sensor histidine kinase [Kribbella jiaozuonensis]TKK80252.1 HAMP domain-containing histidine kinase [Kribbella jiaozuonensis]
MSVISYKPRESATGVRTEPAVRRLGLNRGLVIDSLLAAFMLAMLGLMIRLPGEETIPYHFLFLSLTIVYGFRVWPLLPTLLVALAVTGATGAVLLGRVVDGVIDNAELAEVPLMPALFVAMMWHARRRAAAQQQVERMADERRASLERERGFFRDTSHAIRTPITIARGHLELAGDATALHAVHPHVEVALRQLDRMSALSDRLLALARLDAGEALDRRPTDVAALVAEIGRNWTANTDRVWLIGCGPAGRARIDHDWMELALDALVENAVHFTSSGDTIRIGCTASPGRIAIIVDDSGPGIEPDDLPFVFDRFWHRRPEHGPMGSGLGLSMARAVAEAHGGTLVAAHSDEGGARFVLTIPRSG